MDKYTKTNGAWFGDKYTRFWDSRISGGKHFLFVLQSKLCSQTV